MANAHVLKFYRWQHFLAVQYRRPLAQLHWATMHNSEMSV